MNTIRYTITQAVAEVLAGASVATFEKLEDAFGEDVTKALIYGWVDDDITEYGRADKHALVFELQAYAQGVTADSQCDALLGEAYALITGSKNLAGKIRGITVGRADRMLPPEGMTGMLHIQRFTFGYTAQHGSLTVPA
jgi:hypothetical protein